MIRKCKGYSIIECSVFIAIMMIIIGISGKYVKCYCDLISDISLKSAAYEIDEIINYAKKYCYSSNQTGRIQIIDTDKEGKIVFQSIDGNKKEVYLPCGITFNNIQEGYKTILITPKSVIKGITIELKSSLSKSTATITLNVSANRIKIRKQG